MTTPKTAKRPRFPGWRTMTRAQRYNARMEEIFEQAKARGDWPRSDTERAAIQALGNKD
jgi:hypothetical protein